MTGLDPSVALDVTWSELALALFAPGTVQGTLQRIVDLAVGAVEGCDAAGIFMVEDGRVVTTAYSDPLVVALDIMQFDAGQGPCLDAVSEGATFYAEDLSDDSRWPDFGRAAVGAGIRSLVAFPLSARRPSALNLYARYPAAYGALDRAKGLIFATLGGIALGTAEERATEDERLGNLRDALQTRELIGQAQGILMERERITADQAFDVLRRASQHLNRKLRDVAENVVTTGQSPPAGTGRADPAPHPG
ncbi:MAG: GAF and ANTAR domain-containing protein [Actinomycetota bacterium]|nr:GAF and ANTAR domain-containing protein [Actinomycetota bacterium]